MTSRATNEHLPNEKHEECILILFSDIFDYATRCPTVPKTGLAEWSRCILHDLLLNVANRLLGKGAAFQRHG
jgi:hypothetical protein